MARLTTLEPGQSITRSMGKNEDHELVVTLHGNGTVEVRKKPLRPLRRNEQLPGAVHSASDLADNEGADGSGWLDDLIARLPVASFGDKPEQLSYKAKVWILDELKRMKDTP